jgi:phenylalanyl-tRNA synthetase beta subunit
MPVVDIDTDELRRLTGEEKSDEAFEADLFEIGLEFEGETEEGLFQFEFAPDRLDRLSVEGLRGRSATTTATTAGSTSRRRTIPTGRSPSRRPSPTSGRTSPARSSAGSTSTRRRSTR